jgi:hypothetical protein
MRTFGIEILPEPAAEASFFTATAFSRVQDKKVTDMGLSQLDWCEVWSGLRYCSQNKLK